MYGLAKLISLLCVVYTVMNITIKYEEKTEKQPTLFIIIGVIIIVAIALIFADERAR